MGRISLASFFSGKRVFVTGDAGFIGSHLVGRLINEGASVLILDDLSTGNRRNPEGLVSNESCEIVEGTILSEGDVNPLMRSSDFCFHLAAAVGVKCVIDHPEDCIRRNLNGSEVVF